MPDISMCLNRTCPARETCYRFRAVRGPRQSYNSFDPKGQDRCDGFREIRPGDLLAPIDDPEG